MQEQVIHQFHIIEAIFGISRATLLLMEIRNAFAYLLTITPESYEKFWKENFLLLGIHNLVYQIMGATASLSSPHIEFVQGWR